MAFIVRRILVSLLIPFLWRTWRHRRAAKQSRDGITTRPAPVTVT